MFILCSGEDSYRALEKARELEAAFKQKYDPSGSAVDRLSSGKEGVEALLVAATGGSLFSPRRFFRVDGLISSCPKARLDALMKTLDRDVDNTIIVTVEEGDVAEKNLKSYLSLQKFIHYPFGVQSPAAFLKWATDHAMKQGVSDSSAIKKLVENSLGDSWVFVNELTKWRAGADLVGGSRMINDATVYDLIDRLLVRRPDRWSAIRAFDDANAIVAMAAGQARSLLLVQSGKSSGVHPYVAQKLSRLRDVDGVDTYARLARMLTWSRTGRVSAEEALDVLG